MIALAGGAVALLGAALFPTFHRAPASAAAPVVSAASLAATIAGEETLADADAPVSPSGLAGLGGTSANGETDTTAPRPSVWRVAQLATDDSMSLIETPVGRRSLLSALGAAHLGAGDAARIAQSLALVRNVDRLDPKDTLTVALDKKTGHVVAYELASSPAEIWQGREETQPDGTLKLLARKLPLRADHVRVGKALVVGADLRASFTEAGLTPVDDMLSMLEDALDGHAELSEIRPGARLRLLGTQEQVEGVFSRWVSLDAVEYFPASPDAPSVRVYSSSEIDGSDDADHGEHDKRSRDFYDAKGRQPVHGGLRSPVPGARIASRFNPHRMHPVLHVLMPHNGVDLAAPVGTPVYAAAAGTVMSVGPAGPCGNRVEIAHSGGITSVYCHLSRFTQGLRTGMHVEQRQLIAYVGQTGRVTGPHLHFGIRKNGVFIDPMSLRLDGFRVVPKGQRDDFDRRRAGLDKELDGIPLPAAAAGAAVTEPEHETFYEEP
jgi:murein DD-endopeptidase MepM/ murein hydrolase activator NlpD